MIAHKPVIDRFEYEETVKHAAAAMMLSDWWIKHKDTPYLLTVLVHCKNMEIYENHFEKEMHQHLLHKSKR